MKRHITFSSALNAGRFILASKHTRPERLALSHRGATILDLTSRASQPWVRFSPFYPHGGIAVPFSPGWSAESVEGVWQGLKVFELADVDVSKFAIADMSNLKRSERRLGRCRGHREGVAGERVLDYITARKQIFIPTYTHILRERLSGEIAQLRSLAEVAPVVLLDYQTNPDVDDPTQPLSHVSLVIRWLAGEWQ